MVTGVKNKKSAVLRKLGEMEKQIYNENDLGAVYTPEATYFKVWAPSASRVVLRRYTKGSSTEEGDRIIEERMMEKDVGETEVWKNGVWKTMVGGNLANTYYTYLVTVDGETKETNDIYARAVGLNGQRGMVVNLGATNPHNWEKDHHVMAEKATDAIIWEVHVRDFSNSPDSGMKHKGKYLAFTEKGTTVNGEGKLSTGMDYLKELGISYVQLLPSFDYLNDELDESNEGYNWGYNPLNYNVPEGLYSTNPYDGNVRITEFKQMVQAFHEAGIGVIMDVVYNHVGGDANASWFQRTVPDYYFRQDEKGNLADSGTACGNETASERGMFRKYIVDSVVYWASEYHIDGFRFDLMGCHDVETMNQVRKALNTLPDGEKILVYGEPWAAGKTNQPEEIPMAVQSNMKLLNLGIGAFNDGIRDAVKGHVFYSEATAFVQAGNNKKQPEGSRMYTDENLKAGITGNASTAFPENWAAAPRQTVNYVSCHDNLSLYDKLQLSVNGAGKEGGSRFYKRDANLLAMNKMAAAIIMTSQGSVFFQAGEEFARTKGGVENSYCSPLYYSRTRELNQMAWSRREKFSDLTEYYKGLLKLRRAYAPFRAADLSAIQNLVFSDEKRSNLIAYTISSPGERWDMAAVLMNANPTPQKVKLKAGKGSSLPTFWNCVVNQNSAGTKTLEKYSGNKITVPAQTVLVLTSAEEKGIEGRHKKAGKANTRKKILLITAAGIAAALGKIIYQRIKQSKFHK